MHNLNRFLIGLSATVLIGLGSCNKNASSPAPNESVEVTTFKNQTGNSSAEALQVHLVDQKKKHTIDFYGTFDGNNNPLAVRSVTFRKFDNDMTVHFVLNAATNQLETIYLDVRGTKLPTVIKHSYIQGDNNAIRIGLYTYDWQTNTGVLRNETLFRSANGTTTPLPVFVASRGTATTDFAGSVAGVATGFAVAELVFYSVYSTGLLATYGPAVVVAITAAAPVITVAAATAAVVIGLEILLGKNANAADLQPTATPYPNNVSPTHPSNLPAPGSLPISPCSGSTISFRASMDIQGSILIASVSGGTGPYTYAVANQNFQSNQVFPNNYPDGSYVVSVRGADGCVSAQVVPLSRNTLCLNTTLAPVQQLIAGGPTHRWNRIEFKVNGVSQSSSCSVVKWQFLSNGTHQLEYTRTFNNVCTTYTDSRVYCANATQLELVDGVGAHYTTPYSITNNRLVVIYTEKNDTYQETFEPI